MSIFHSSRSLLRVVLILLAFESATAKHVFAQSSTSGNATAVNGASISGRDVVGNWSGAIELPTDKLEINLHFVKTDSGSLSGTIDIPIQGISGNALKDVRHTGDSLLCEIANIPGRPRFLGVISSDGATYSGIFRQAGAKLPFAVTFSSGSSSAGSSRTASATSTTLDSLRTFYRKVLKEWNVPGMSVAIVKDGEVLLTEGFGYRDVANKLPVTANTLFAIGSSTKAFTSALMANLVADGKVEWNKPVRDYLPTFRLQDPVATENLTVKDMLTHVSGLPRHDMMWYGNTLTRQELFDRLQYLEPTAKLHERWQYQNLMFMSAGLLEQQLTGKTWETLVHDQIFVPLGMNSSNTSVDLLSATNDHALGYGEIPDKSKEHHASAKTDLPLKVLPYRHIDAMGPAGSINSNAIDMAKWIQLNIGEGTFGGKQVIGKEAISEVHTPQVVIGRHPGAKEIQFDLYAMGWMVHAFRGSEILEHGGNIDGFSAEVAFMPKEKLGVVVLTNKNGTPAPTLVMYHTMDRLLGHSEKDWSAYALAKMNAGDSAVSGEDDPVVKEDVIRVADTHPSHSLSSYVGEYENPAYGVFRIGMEKKQLAAQFRDMHTPLEHYHYDVFAAPDTSESIGGLKVAFQTDINGNIQSLSTALEPQVSPIVFTRRASKELSDTTYLGKFVGSYSISGADMQISRNGDKLLFEVPNQPIYTLIPTKENEFDIKDLKGFSLRFIVAAGKVTKLLAIQPNGTFEAVRH